MGILTLIRDFFRFLSFPIQKAEMQSNGKVRIAYQLVDRAGYAFDGAEEEFVLLAKDTYVGTMKSAIKEAHKNQLEKFDAAQLKVHKNVEFTE